MNKQYQIGLFFLIISLSTHAQWVVEFEQEIPVTEENTVLNLPWSGGLNSGQYYNIDLNQDGQQDLIIFDRTSDQFIPLLSQNQEFVYAPEYSLYFPKNINSWVVFADYDGDGRQDLFTASGKRSITVYHNVSEKQLAWEKVADPLGTVGFSGFEIAIQINPSDIPAIADIDNDGDLDIIVYNVNGRGNLEYYQNMGREENSGNSLLFEAKDETWGEIKECGCGEFAFEGSSCGEINGKKETNAKQLHVGGKTLLSIDIDGDGDKDILSSDEGCGELYFLENIGTAEEALFTSFSTTYLEELTEGLISFPAAYHVDVTHDGIKDLVVAPNVNGETAGSDDMRVSSWSYENTGTKEIPEFTFRKRDFLQAEMIDVGENAAPVLADYDADGDLDLFIGQRGHMHEDGYYAGVYLYQNVGSTSDPSYTLVTSDYLGLSQWKLQQIKIYFEDINGDGRKDLLLSGAEDTFSSTASFYWIANQSSGQMSWDFEPEQRQALSLGFHPADQLEFVDADKDGDQDVFIAKREGNLEYHQNQGTVSLADWKLVSENAGGISSSVFNRNLSILLYDFDGDGEKDLLRSDANGVILLSTNFLSHLEGETAADTVISKIDSQEKVLKVDKRVSFAAAPLDDSEKTYLFLGSPQGGIRLLSHSKGRNTVDDDSALLIFPNPAYSAEPYVKVHANSSIKWLQVISMTGAIMADVEIKESLKEMRIDVTGLAKGIYLVRVWDNEGEISSGKMMVR